MRSLLLLTLVAVATTYGIVKTLPESEADAETTPGKPGEVQSVALDGRGLPSSALREVLATHAGEQLDDAKLDRDRAALEQVLVAHGYLDAQVNPAHVVYDGFGAAFVTFPIAKGALFHINAVTIKGAVERDAGVQTLAKGAPATKDKIELVRAALAERLAARGKHVTVDATLAADQAAHTVDLELSAH